MLAPFELKASVPRALFWGEQRKNVYSRTKHPLAGFISLKNKQKAKMAISRFLAKSETMATMSETKVLIDFTLLLDVLVVYTFLKGNLKADFLSMTSISLCCFLCKLSSFLSSRVELM